MITVKKSESTTLKGKGIAIINDKLADKETGEEIDIISILKDAFGTATFDLSAVKKVESEE